MPYCWLRYRPTPAGTPTSQRFNALSLYVDDTLVDRIQPDVTMRGRLVDHMVRSRSVYPITIGPDELLDSTKWAFIRAFFKANYRELSLDTGVSTPADETFVAVLLEGGRLPVERIEQLSVLRMFSATLVAKEPD